MNMINFLSVFSFNMLYIRPSSGRYYAVLAVVAIILAAVAFVLFIKLQIRK